MIKASLVPPTAGNRCCERRMKQPWFGAGCNWCERGMGRTVVTGVSVLRPFFERKASAALCACFCSLPELSAPIQRNTSEKVSSSITSLDSRSDWAKLNTSSDATSCPPDSVSLMQKRRGGCCTATAGIFGYSPAPHAHLYPSVFETAKTDRKAPL